MADVKNPAVETEEKVRESKAKEIWRRFKKNKAAMIGLVIFVILLLVAIFADLIVDYDVCITLDVPNRLQKPGNGHIFGTDGYGRDVFARIVHGARYSLGIGLAATLMSLFIGGSLGTIAAYYGGKVDTIIMRMNDILVAIPVLLLGLAIVSALGSSVLNLIIAITVGRIPFFIRVIRSAVLGLVDQEFIEAARAGGVKDGAIIVRHILPNAIGTILVQTTMSISFVILQAATLSFVGMGIKAPTPEWAFMLSEAKEFMRGSIYLMIFPGACICLAALSSNLVGDGLRDALDPRLKN